MLSWNAICARQERDRSISKAVVMTITVRKIRIRLMQDYTWSETIDEVVITIPLKGVKPSKALVMIM